MAAVNFTFSFTGAEPSALTASSISTANSVNAQVPLNERPGPLQGRLGSFNSSSRNPVMFCRSVVPRRLVEYFVGAYPCARIEWSPMSI